MMFYPETGVSATGAGMMGQHDELVVRLRAPHYWMSGSEEGHEGDNDTPREAADAIESLQAQLAEAQKWADKFGRELDEISAAIGTTRYMDPPDGGDVSLAEQVRRMKAELAEAQKERDMAVEHAQLCNAAVEKAEAEAEAAVRSRDEIVGVAKECADDLEAEINGRYVGMQSHPAMKRKFERDMEPVLRLRSLIEAVDKMSVKARRDNEVDIKSAECLE